MQPSPPAARNPFGTVRRAASRGETRMPRACAGSKSSRRPPALARERLPASSGRPASPACAAGANVLQSRVFLRASPPAPRAPKGSVSPAGAWGKRKATRRREQIQELRAAGAQNAGIDGEGKRVLTKKAAAGGLFRQAAAGTIRARRFFAPPRPKKISFFPCTAKTRRPFLRPGGRRSLHRYALFSVLRFSLDLRICLKQLEAAFPLEPAHRQQVVFPRQILVEYLVPEPDPVRVLARAAVVHHGDVGP